MHLKKIFAKIAGFDKQLGHKPLLVTCGTLVACAVIIALRAPEAFTHPQFWAEDGVVWFGQAYNQGFWQTIFQPYSGTFSLLTRLVGYLATLVPLAYAPLFFSVAALLVQLLPVFIIMSSRFQHITRYRLVAIAACLAYVCIPNVAEVFVNLANIQWHLGIASLLLLIAGKPTRRAWIIFDVIVLGITGLTGPLGLALAVIAFFMWCRERDRVSFMRVAVLAVTSICQAVSLFILAPGQRGGHMVMPAIDAVKMVSGQIFTGGILGESNVDYFYGSFWLFVVLGVGLLIILYGVVRGPSWVRYANLFSLIILTLILASLKPLEGVDVWGLLTKIGVGQRYWYIPIFVWLATLLWVALAAKNRALRLMCSCFMLLFVFVGVPDSWTIVPKPDRNYQYHVRIFNQLDSGKTYGIPTNPEGWSIVLRKH